MNAHRDAQGRFTKGNSYSKGNKGNTVSASKYGNKNGFKYGYLRNIKGYRTTNNEKIMASWGSKLRLLDKTEAIMDHQGRLYIRKDVLLNMVRGTKSVEWFKKSDIIKRTNEAETRIIRTIL